MGTFLVLLGLAVLLGGGIVYQGLVKIPANPPNVGVMTVLGRRVHVILKEGWHFLPGYPWIFGFVRIPVVKSNLDLTIESVRTPDRAMSTVQVAITWKPNTDTPEELIEYLNSGGKEGVEDILADIVREHIREWAFSPKKGTPQTWRELMGAQREATALLVEAICDLPSDAGGRKRAIKDLVEGNGNRRVPQLGIRLLRLNVGEILITGAVAEAAEKQAKEVEERAAETLELEHLSERLKELMTPTGNGGRGLTKQEAIDLVQSERGKVTRTIDEKRLSLGSESQDAIKEIAATVATTIANAMGGKKNG